MDEVTRARIDRIFMPGSIAIVGASHKEYRASYHVVKGLRELGFAGRIYPVNPQLSTLQGLAVYPSVLEIPGAVDLAYIAVPAEHVPRVLEECGRKGIHSAIIYSSGFSEAGEAGARLEKTAIAVARRHGISFIGPNCIGVADSFSKNTYYSDVPLEPGALSLIAHSGSLCGSITRMGFERGITYARTVSLGNRADLGTCDFLEYLGDDPQTAMIAMHLESVTEGQRFLRALEAITPRKPVLAWKAGRTRAGSRAAASHTAAMASDQAVMSAALSQGGAVECNGIEELLDYAVMFHSQRPCQGTRLGIVSSPGGVAVAAADACEEQGLSLAEYAGETVQRLRAIVPSFGSPLNPVDLTTQVFFDLQLYSRAVEIVMEDPGVDLVLVIAPAEMHPAEFARLVQADAVRWRKPFAVSLTAPLRIFQQELAIMRAVPVPLYPTVERAVRALSVYAGWRARRSRDHEQVEVAGRNLPGVAADSNAAALLRRLTAERGSLLDEHSAKRFLAACGLPVARELVASTPAEAARLSADIGFPLVLKAVVDGVSHKTELGLVRCGISSGEELAHAVARMQSSMEEHGLVRSFRSWLLQEWIDIGQELIVGVKRDPTFGPVVLFGLGGTAVEVLKDTSLGVAPFTRETALGMVRSLRSFPLLDGFRGAPRVDQDLLAGILVRIGSVAVEIPELAELDINPLAARRGGELVVVDAVLRTTAESTPGA